MKDQEVIELIKKKDNDGINELLLNYTPLIMYIISPIITNEKDREDCLSEIIIHLWNNIKKFDSKRGSWTTWLTAITRNYALNFKRKNYLHNYNEEITADIPSYDPSPEEQVIKREKQEAVNNALKSLSDKDRTLFYRKYYYMQSTVQIASEMGMTERGVEGKLYRIKKKLRIILGGAENE